MRRLNVPGFFDYPWDKDDIQQNTALAECLAGDTQSEDAAVAIRFDRNATHATLRGCARTSGTVGRGIRNRRCQAVEDRFCWRKSIAPNFRAPPSVIHGSHFGIARDGRCWMQTFRRPASLPEVGGNICTVASPTTKSKMKKGARTHYLTQRAPEFEIDDLRIDVELQKSYGIRRELRSDPGGLRPPSPTSTGVDAAWQTHRDLLAQSSPVRR